MPKREAPESVMRDLCEAVDAWYGMDNTEAQPGWCEESKRMFAAMQAYRAATAPLRTRAEVDAERLLNLDAWRANVISSTELCMRDSILCSEQTSGPGGEDADPPPCAPPGATYSPLVERVLASDEPEACSCDEALALREKLEHIETECELYFRGKKLAPEAMTAIRGLLPCRNQTT
jgi:hypothetical protein